MTNTRSLHNFTWWKNWWTITVNFWTGCLKVSPGCKFCYMFREQEFHKNDPTLIKKTGTALWKKVYKLKEPSVVFVNSWSDFWIEVPVPDTADETKTVDLADEWRKQAFEIFKAHPQHIFIIPTKRVDRITPERLPADWGEGYPNVWLGTSVENQMTADTRIPILAKIKAAVKFLSIEPLLEYVSLSGLPLDALHWIILGGESGNDVGKYRYRPSEQDAFQLLVDQAHAAGKPVFVKQLGTHLAKQLGLKDRTGANMSEEKFPQTLKFREFPKDLSAIIPPENKAVA